MKYFVFQILLQLSTNKQTRQLLTQYPDIQNDIKADMSILDLFISIITRPFQMLLRFNQILNNTKDKPLIISNEILQRNILISKCILKIYDINYIIGDNLKLKNVCIVDTETIPDECFVNNISLSKVVVSKETKHIKINAFKNCISLQKIYLPKTLKQIDTYAFKNCISLKEVIFY